MEHEDLKELSHPSRWDVDTRSTLGQLQTPEDSDIHDRKYRKNSGLLGHLDWAILDKWPGISDHTGMADHTVPDYALDDTLDLDSPEQYRALFEETRLRIVDLLGERAATTSQLANVLGRPKGTIGHHIQVLAEAGLIHVVRTEKVRAIEAKYYGRTARTFNLTGLLMVEAGVAPESVIADAVAEMRATALREYDHDMPGLASLRYARIPEERAGEWADRLSALLEEFLAEPRAGDTVFGLAVALYPTDRPHLPE